MERNLFDELQVQKQILKGQPQPKPKLEIVSKTEEKQFYNFENISSLLTLEEELMELMLKYGDRILTRRDSENNTYQTTVIEEIIHHFQEDDCEIFTETNKKIIEEIQQGLEQNEIRSGNFFFGLMDEDISGKIADALVENHEISNWKKFNIYFPVEEEVLGKVVRDVILRHKREYVLKLIEDLKKSLDETEEKAEIYEQIVRLNQLKIKIDQKLFRIL
jgi:DNA primase